MHGYAPYPALGHPRIQPNVNDWARSLTLAPSSTRFENILRLNGCEAGVTISVSLLPGQASYTTRYAGAQIVWGSGAAQTAEVDIGRGTIISVAGMSVEVNLRNESASGDAQFLASAWPGLRPSIPAVRTVNTGTLAVGAAEDLTIPAFARSVTIQRMSTSTTSISVSPLDGSFAYLDEIVVPTGESAPTILLPNTAVYVRITNTGVDALTRAQGVFDLRI